MTPMNKEKLHEVLEQAATLNGGEGGSRLPDDLLDTFDLIFGGDHIKQPDGFTVHLEEQFGGEGLGDDFWYVLSVTDKSDDSKTYVRFNGWYASHYGHEFDDSDFQIVEPREVTVTQWFPVGN